MKGLLTPKQLSRIEKTDYSTYEYLVAKHMWHVLKRKVAKSDTPLVNLPDIKKLIAIRYEVDWLYDCWLCEVHTSGGKKQCSDCALCSLQFRSDGIVSGCGFNDSPYRMVTASTLKKNVRVAACDDIIDAIDKEAKGYGII